MAQYDTIGTNYDVVKTTSFNKLERFNFYKNLKPLLSAPGSQAVLDLACGTGFYSRLLLEWGAGSVVGMDISLPMINGAVARLSKDEYASQARFVQGDGLIPRTYGSEAGEDFDLVTGAWFLNYSQNEAELKAMFETIAINLRPSGVFVGICLHPTDELESYAGGVNASAWAKTGVLFEYQSTPTVADGLGYEFKVTVPPPPGSQPSTEGVEFNSYHLKKSLYEEAARAGGMKGQLEWRKCEFLDDSWRSEIGLDGDKAGWQTLQDYPLLSIMVLWKE